MAYFIRPGTPIQSVNIFPEVCFGNYTIIRVLKALDWLSSISGAKIMPQKTKSGQNFYPYKLQPGVKKTHIGYGHKSPPE